MAESDSGRSLGKLVSVTADQFTVELNAGQDGFTLVGFDAQHYVARIGSFVLIPVQASWVVAEVTGMREIEGSDVSKGDFDLQDSPGLHSRKLLDLTPVGTLPLRDDGKFGFGVSVFPPLYSDVLYSEQHDIDRIFGVDDKLEVDDGTITNALTLGTSVVFDDYAVKARLDDLFGGHAAVLGNTGSGKSCTVASIVQSLFSKTDPLLPTGSRFLFFDTNGEYSQAFAELPKYVALTTVRVAGVRTTEPSGEVGGQATQSSSSQTDAGAVADGVTQEETVEDGPAIAQTDTGVAGEKLVGEFRLPHWFMSAEEWELLLRASERAQKPILRAALGIAGLLGKTQPEASDARRHVLGRCGIASLIASENATNASTRIQSLVVHYADDFDDVDEIIRLTEIDYAKWIHDDAPESLFKIFSGMTDDAFELPPYANEPFDFDLLSAALDLAVLYEEANGNKRARDYCSSMVTRLSSIQRREEFKFLRTPAAEETGSAADFVDKFVSIRSHGDPTQITIIDMNDVDDEVVELIAAVVARLVFEEMRALKARASRPAVLVLEEAHRYVAQKPSDFAIDATSIFERIAKEGRKYGLSILLASQRPSEISATVLSQCSNFIVHRIQNPDDLHYVRRMTPYISEPVIQRLPALPKQHALVFGNSVNIPTTFRVRDAVPRPRSDDPRVVELWFEKAVE